MRRVVWTYYRLWSALVDARVDWVSLYIRHHTWMSRIREVLMDGPVHQVRDKLHTHIICSVCPGHFGDYSPFTDAAPWSF